MTRVQPAELPTELSTEQSKEQPKVPSATEAAPDASAVPEAYEINGYPTVTIIDTVPEKKPAKTRRCCFCVPERAGVITILSLIVFFGILNTAASFSGLAFSHTSQDYALLVVYGIISFLFTMVGIFGIMAIRRGNAIMTRHLSIMFWVLTVLSLVLSFIIYILEAVAKPAAIEDCKQTLIELYGGDEAASSGVDCNEVVNVLLVKEAFKLVFLGAIQIYFAYVMLRYARRMMENARAADFDVFNSSNAQLPPTYHVYANRPPTSTDWVPPPTYNGNPRNIPLAEKDASNLA